MDDAKITPGLEAWKSLLQEFRKFKENPQLTFEWIEISKWGIRMLVSGWTDIYPVHAQFQFVFCMKKESMGAMPDMWNCILLGNNTKVEDLDSIAHLFDAID